MRGKPGPDEYPEWYDGYVKSVPEGNILDILQSQLEVVETIASGIDEDTALFRYAPGKWSIKEVFGHINDAERILSYRALRYIRRDTTDIPQYDHDEYVTAAGFPMPTDRQRQCVRAIGSFRWNRAKMSCV